MNILKKMLYVLGSAIGKLKTSQLEKIKQDNESIDRTFLMSEPYLLNLNNTHNCLVIKKNVVFRSFCNIYISGNAKLTINENVFFNNYCSLNCLSEIHIGADSIFGEGVKIYDHNHSYSIANEIINVSRNDFTLGKVIIGKNCWIGSNVTILSNVIIGDNVIIGANCLVYKSVPSNTVVKAKIELIK